MKDRHVKKRYCVWITADCKYIAKIDAAKNRMTFTGYLEKLVFENTNEDLTYLKENNNE